MIVPWILLLFYCKEILPRHCGAKRQSNLIHFVLTIFENSINNASDFSSQMDIFFTIELMME